MIHIQVIYRKDIKSRSIFHLDLWYIPQIQHVSRKDIRSRGIFHLDTLDTKDIRDIDVVFKIRLNNQNFLKDISSEKKSQSI